jgi:hypothetical protein
VALQGVRLGTRGHIPDPDTAVIAPSNDHRPPGKGATRDRLHPRGAQVASRSVARRIDEPHRFQWPTEHQQITAMLGRYHRSHLMQLSVVHSRTRRPVGS